MSANYKYQVVKIDDARIDEACDAYFKWKDLNSYVKSVSTRGINMPDVISEPIGCYCLGFEWNRGKSGDATDPKTGDKIEFKATSKFDGDLSSFGPKCVFDNLVFLRFNIENNYVFIYILNINSSDFDKLKVNNKETVEDQKKQGRRPHVSLNELFVKRLNLKPDIIFDIRRMAKYNKGHDVYNKIFEELEGNNDIE